MTNHPYPEPTPHDHPAYGHAHSPGAPHAGASTSRITGWEIADGVASGVGAAARGIGWLLIKLWGLLLVVASVAVLIWTGGEYWWGFLVIIGYGVYLLLPGSKWIIW